MFFYPRMQKQLQLQTVATLIVSLTIQMNFEWLFFLWGSRQCRIPFRRHARLWVIVLVSHYYQSRNSSLLQLSTRNNLQILWAFTYWSLCFSYFAQCFVGHLLSKYHTCQCPLLFANPPFLTFLLLHFCHKRELFSLRSRFILSKGDKTIPL